MLRPSSTEQVYKTDTNARKVPKLNTRQDKTRHLRAIKVYNRASCFVLVQTKRTGGRKSKKDQGMCFKQQWRKK